MSTLSLTYLLAVLILPGMPGTRAVLDHDRCAGVTMCVQAAPEAFALNDDGQPATRGDVTDRLPTDGLPDQRHPRRAELIP
jgi:ferredoxin